MNNYPAWWNTTITVYNRYENPTTKEITWYRTVLQNCFWKQANIEEIIIASRLQYHSIQSNSNSTICRIPKNNKFLSKAVWNNSNTKSSHFTLAPEDIIVKGICSATIDEYTKGLRSSDFVKNQKLSGECITIVTAVDNTGEGRYPEHYHILGE